MNEIRIPKTLSDVCETRLRVLEQIERAHQMLEDAESALGQVARFTWPRESSPRNNYADTVREIDQRLWREAFDMTGFLLLMDEEAKRKFFDELGKDAPPFTEANIRSTFLTLAQEADAMFVRGLVNVFRRLSKEHRTNTNSPFKVNGRAILPYMVSVRWRGGLEVNYRSSERLNDLDRVFKLLAGKVHQPRALEFAINAVFVGGNYYEDGFYEIRGYRNGNMHLRFKRTDLLDKANRLIGDYYDGNALAKGGKKARP